MLTPRADEIKINGAGPAEVLAERWQGHPKWSFVGGPSIRLQAGLGELDRAAQLRALTPLDARRTRGNRGRYET